MLEPPPKPPQGSPPFMWDQYLWLLSLYESQGPQEPSGDRLDRLEGDVGLLESRPIGSASFTGNIDTPQTIEAGHIYRGNAAGKELESVAPGASGNVLQSDGTTWAAALAIADSGIARFTEQTPSAAASVELKLSDIGVTDTDVVEWMIRFQSLSSSSNAILRLDFSDDDGSTYSTATAEQAWDISRNNTTHLGTGSNAALPLDITETITSSGWCSGWVNIAPDGTNSRLTCHSNTLGTLTASVSWMNRMSRVTIAGTLDAVKISFSAGNMTGTINAATRQRKT